MPPANRYTPDLARLNQNSADIRARMLEGMGDTGVSVEPPSPGVAMTGGAAAAAPAGVSVEPAAEAAPAAPATTLYGAPGDPWVYEVSDDGTVRVSQDGEQWMEATPGTVIHAAVQDQLRNGVLQPGQGAAAALGQTAAGDAAPEPTPAAPEPAPGEAAPLAKHELMDPASMVSGPQSPQVPTHEVMDPQGAILGAQSQQPQPPLAKHELMDPQGAILGSQSPQPPTSPVVQPQYPWRDFIKGLVRETMAEDQVAAAQ